MRYAALPPALFDYCSVVQIFQQLREFFKFGQCNNNRHAFAVFVCHVLGI